MRLWILDRAEDDLVAGYRFYGGRCIHTLQKTGEPLTFRSGAGAGFFDSTGKTQSEKSPMGPVFLTTLIAALAVAGSAGKKSQSKSASDEWLERRHAGDNATRSGLACWVAHCDVDTLLCSTRFDFEKTLVERHWMLQFRCPSSPPYAVEVRGVVIG